MNHPDSASTFRSPRRILLAAAMAAGALGAAACKSNESATAPASSTAAAAASPAPAPATTDRVDLSNERTAKVAVVSVDQLERLVTLRREDGTMFTLECSPEVRNFDQIRAGDTLRVRYHESLAATLLRDGASTSAPEAAYALGRAKPGDSPAGGVGMAARVRVRVESVDREKDLVVFSTDSGDLRTARAARPEGRKFVAGLKPGDIVQLDYTQSLALAIEKL